ncbi:MAG: Hsp20/alpha crystallin family protein [Thermoanaerobaculia bacterium]
MATRLTTVQIVSQLKSELDRLLEVDSRLVLDLQDGSVLPVRFDVVQSDTEVSVLVEVPGMSADQLEVTVAGNMVTVAGDKVAPGRASVDGRYLCVERPWGRFERSVELPVIVNPRKGRAVLGRGVLRIDLPTLTEQRNQPVRLRIENADGGIVE